jgi:DnaJ-class molecular chaperone
MIEKTVTSEELRTKYIRLAKVLHPDHNPNDPDADQKFQELQKQYEKARKILGVKTQYQASISITLKESILGTERFFTTDDGKQKFSLSIPAGVKNKQTISFRGITVNSVTDTALHIKILIDVPHDFSIVGEQLILKESVSYWKLFFGGKHKITGATGNQIIITVAKRTKSEKMFKVRGEGLWNRVENKRNPLYIQFFGSII